jgi:hypothetical protein
MVKACEGEAEVFAWLLCDHTALRKYGLGCVAPFPLPIGRHLRSGYLQCGATLAELAERLNIAPATLEATIAEFNAHAKSGDDPAFGKGSKPTIATKAMRSLRRTVRCSAGARPYYAIRLVIGDIGTFAGLVTDETPRARCVRQTNKGPLRSRQ